MASDVGGIGSSFASYTPMFRVAKDAAHGTDEEVTVPRETNPTAKSAMTGRALTEEETRQVEQLKTRDREVRSHEQAHMAAAGSLAKGGPTYEYKRGPDGKQYVTNGEVQIDSRVASGSPEAAIAKAQQIRRAALAPADPSGQDRAVAAQAAAMEQEARSKLAKEADDAEPPTLTQFTQASKVDSSRETMTCSVCGLKNDHTSETHSSAIQTRLQGVFSVIEGSSSDSAGPGVRISTLA